MSNLSWSRVTKAAKVAGIILSTTTQWPRLSDVVKGAEGGIVHLVSADNGAYYAELWGREGGSYYAVTGAGIYQMPGLAKGAKLDEALKVFLQEVVGKAKDEAELPNTADLVKALSTLKKSVRALDKHDTPNSPHKEHDPRYGKGKTEETHPGKFEGSGSLGEKLHAITMDSGQDDELGDVEGFGWYALITNTGIKGARHVIVHEDNQGFFDYDDFGQEKDARAAWDDLQAEYEQWESEGEGEEGDDLEKGKTTRRVPKRREAMWKAEGLEKHETPGRPHTDRSGHWHQSVQGQSVRVPGRKSDARIYQTPAVKAKPVKHFSDPAAGVTKPQPYNTLAGGPPPPKSKPGGGAPGRPTKGLMDSRGIRREDRMEKLTSPFAKAQATLRAATEKLENCPKAAARAIHKEKSWGQRRREDASYGTQPDPRTNTGPAEAQPPIDPRAHRGPAEAQPVKKDGEYRDTPIDATPVRVKPMKKHTTGKPHPHPGRTRESRLADIRVRERSEQPFYGQSPQSQEAERRAVARELARQGKKKAATYGPSTNPSQKHGGPLDPKTGVGGRHIHTDIGVARAHSHPVRSHRPAAPIKKAKDPVQEWRKERLSKPFKSGEPTPSVRPPTRRQRTPKDPVAEWRKERLSKPFTKAQAMLRAATSALEKRRPAREPGVEGVWQSQPAGDKLRGLPARESGTTRNPSSGSWRRYTPKQSKVGKEDTPHGGPRGGQGRLHGHLGPGGDTHEHDYGTHSGVKISPPQPRPPESRTPGHYGSGYSEHERKFGHPASHANLAEKGFVEHYPDGPPPGRSNVGTPRKPKRDENSPLNTPQGPRGKGSRGGYPPKKTHAQYQGYPKPKPARPSFRRPGPGRG